MAKKPQENYLDYVPVISDKNTWSQTDGVVTVHMVHRGFYDVIAQKVFHRPRVSHIELDRIGSFVFPLIDGKRTVGELALLVKEQFGDEAEPLYQRFIEYRQILRKNKFVYFAGKERVT